jgi:uncharacterized membrane protein
VNQTRILSGRARVSAPRVQAIDVVRGVAMVIMALDHAREFWSPTAVRAEDVAQASALLFLTRWATYFCAPTFVFLSGASIYLYQQKQPGRLVVSRFLLTRGLWLVVLELVVVNLLVHWDYSLILLQVIWVIGWSMVALAALLWLPRWLLAALTLTFLSAHNLLPAIQPVTGENVGWALLHNGPFVYVHAPFPALLVAYSIGPWLGVMLAGYLTGALAAIAAAPAQPAPAVARRQGCCCCSCSCAPPIGTATPAPGAGRPGRFVYSALSFVNVTKYPPSLLVRLPHAGRSAAPAQCDGTGRQPPQPMASHLRPGALLLLPAAPAAHLRRRLVLDSASCSASLYNFSFIAINEWPAAYDPQPAPGLRRLAGGGAGAVRALSLVSAL